MLRNQPERRMSEMDSSSGTKKKKKKKSQEIAKMRNSEIDLLLQC